MSMRKAGYDFTNHVSKFVNVSGSHVKSEYKFDKKKQELVKVKEIDFQAKIQSYAMELDFKNQLQRLVSEDPSGDKVLARFPQREGAYYGDMSEAPTHVLEAIDMAGEFFERLDSHFDKKLEPKKEEPKKEEPKKEVKKEDESA